MRLHRFYVHSNLTKCSIVAEDFKSSFEAAQKSNAELSQSAPPKEPEPVPTEGEGVDGAEAEEAKDETKGETKEETKETKVDTKEEAKEEAKEETKE